MLLPLHMRCAPSPPSPPPVLRHRCFRRRSRLRHAPVLQSLRGDQWERLVIRPEVVQERLSSLLLKAQALLADAVKPGQETKSGDEEEIESTGSAEEVFLASDVTMDRRTPGGYLSLAAIFSIEQFGRMNGLTGRKMKRIYESLAPEHSRYDGRSLIEYCCFRYLSRDSSDFHQNLKDSPFQRLIFITMLAWEQPYVDAAESQASSMSAFLQRRLVGEEAFVRIAPSISGVADTSTAHHLFKTLAGDKQGISLKVWTTYVAELFKIHQGRKSYGKGHVLLNEQLLCLGSSRKRPVLKWENNVAWPGTLTLTDKALYFEGIGLTSDRKSIRLDLSIQGSKVEKAKVGPFGSKLFDSAVSVLCGKSETLVLEFVDFGGDMRRDLWYTLISEIISLYAFIREFGPADDDPTIHYIYNAHKGKGRALKSVANNIARIQSLQVMQRLPEDPSKLVQFSYLRNAPFGDVVLQSLAVKFWGGQLITKFPQTDYRIQQVIPYEGFSSSTSHIVDIDGSVYLRQWMISPTWVTSASVTFWKNSLLNDGIVLGRNLVVSDLSIVEKAALTCKEKSRIVERTQATIDSAMIKGIPSNIDLFKELMFPLVAITRKFDKLRRWEEPHMTLAFILSAYVVILRNILPLVFPFAMMIVATSMLLLKVLKEQGRLGRSFGKITIHDQPPSNTIQKIIALKEAIADMENFLQNVNISLLKIRTIVLAGQPEKTTQVALVLLFGSAALLLVPFKYILALVVLDIFTRELDFRREMSMRFIVFLKERWDSVHASPVAVLPYEGDGPCLPPTPPSPTKEEKRTEPAKTQSNVSSAFSGIEV